MKFKINILFICMIVLLTFDAKEIWAQNFAGMAAPEETKSQEETTAAPIIATAPEKTHPASPVAQTSEPLPEAYIPPAQTLTNSQIPAAAAAAATAVAPLPDEPSAEYSSHYTLGNADVIDVQVLRHPEVSGQFIINNEGKIQYDFVGDVEIAGLTKQQVKDLIAEKLSTYIVAPEVNVKITGYNSKVVYVVGEVGRPGKIYMRGDTITIREALLEAGLPLLSASMKKSKLITPSERGKPQQKQVDVDALLYEGDLRENLVMKPGDTLYVPATFMAKALRVIQPVAQPVSTAAGGAREAVAPFP